MAMRDDLAQSAEEQNIKTIRILRTTQAADVKEMVKEFFRFIGCLVHDIPVQVEEKSAGDWTHAFAQILNEPTKHDVDLILMTEYRPWLAALTANAQKCFPKRKIIGMSFALDQDVVRLGNTQFILPDDTKQAKIRSVIDVLIDNIWNDPLDTKKQTSLHQINELYYQCELFHYFQMKRTFRVANMNEVLKLGANHYDIPYKPYIDRMLRAFYGFRVHLISLQPKTVYSIYAATNAARKIREIYSVLSENSEYRRRKAVPTVEVGVLLRELNGIYQSDPKYAGMYYLAAYLCQSDENRILDAYNYYRQARELSLKETDGFYAFGIYQLGHYLGKTLRESILPQQLYQEAEAKNRRCYQAAFQIACCYTVQGRFEQAANEFTKVIAILSNGLNLKELPTDLPCWEKAAIDVFYKEGFGGWEYLSLKEIQYLYKSYIWLAQIAMNQKRKQESGQYVRRALSAAIAYWCAPMLQRCCDSRIWNIVRMFHIQGLPVRALFVTLDRVTAITGATDDLKAQIEEDVLHYQDMYKKEESLSAQQKT